MKRLFDDPRNRPAQGGNVLRRAALACCVALLVLVVTATGCFFPVYSTSSTPNIHVIFQAADGNRPARFELLGLPAEALDTLRVEEAGSDKWQEWFTVQGPLSGNDPAQIATLIPMLGDYRIENDKLVFEPRFPLRSGSTYSAHYSCRISDGGSYTGSKIIETAPVSETPPAEISAVFPSRNVLPENQLKFYLHFSAPMSRGEAYERIHLLKASGEEVEFPFLELGEELWDDTGTRFTLFFDPGRIKQGLRPREDLGPSLVEGESYTLVIDDDWLDAQGKPLAAGFRKPFRAVGPDDVQPDLKKWQLTAPQGESVEPLDVVFNEPLDHAMLHRVLAVTDAAGQTIEGKIQVDREETRWRFTPSAPWKLGGYALVVDTTLEDLAGNSLAKPFEVDMFREVEKQTRVETAAILFEVK